MADVYVVNATQLNVRKGPSVNDESLYLVTNGTEVTVYETSNGWGKIAKNNDKWINMTYLKKVSTEKNKDSDKSSDNNETDSSNSYEENTDKAKDDTIYGTSDSSYNTLLLRYIRSFGSPPRYTEEVDPYYNSSDKGIQTGRAMMKTWFSDPGILSLCPGTVDYLPGFSIKKKNKFFNKIKGAMSGNLLSAAESDANSDLNGKLYEFKSSYASYINVVNLLARVSADYLGIGEVNDIIYGTKIPLNKFDYGYYTNPSKSSSSKSLFNETKNALNSAVSDNCYIHFFVNHSGASVTESITTEAGSSMLEEYFGSDSAVSQLSRNLQFLFGGAITPEAENDIQGILKEARDSNELIGGIATIATNYLKGGRLVFPKMITGMSYEKSINVQLQFTAVYGDKRAIFKQVMLPSLHLLAMATPLQLSKNMYTYPYLVRCYQKGVCNTDLAFIHNLEFTRGGSDGTCWTVDGLTTEITASFTITPLYSNLMVTSAKNPFLFMNNTALMEYLGTMCGLDLKANNLSVKIKLAKNLIANRIHDIPTNAARGIVDTKLMNEIRKYTQIIN